MGDFDNVGFNRGTYGHLLDPGGFFAENNQPGIGGTYAPPADYTQAKGYYDTLQRDPQTGMFYDPTTGTSYVDANGQHPVTNPNVAQQVAANFGRSQSSLGHLSGVQAQQGQLAGSLRDVISGRAPSIAGMQTQQNLNAAAAQQMSQAAGVGGSASPLAHLLAMRNTGQAQIAAGNASAIGRVAEQNAARGQLSQLLGEQASVDATLGQGFAGLANTGQAANQGLQMQGDEQQNKKQAAGIGALGALLA